MCSGHDTTRHDTTRHELNGVAQRGGYCFGKTECRRCVLAHRLKTAHVARGRGERAAETLANLMRFFVLMRGALTPAPMMAEPVMAIPLQVHVYVYAYQQVAWCSGVSTGNPQ